MTLGNRCHREPSLGPAVYDMAQAFLLNINHGPMSNEAEHLVWKQQHRRVHGYLNGALQTAMDAFLLPQAMLSLAAPAQPSNNRCKYGSCYRWRFMIFTCFEAAPGCQ
jgi:hypothetical protein